MLVKTVTHRRVMTVPAYLSPEGGSIATGFSYVGALGGPVSSVRIHEMA